MVSFSVSASSSKGFMRVLVGACLEGTHDEVGFGLGGDHEHLDVGVALRTHAFEHVEAVHDGHVPVDEGEVEGVAVVQAGHGKSTVGGFFTVDAFALEQTAEEAANES